MVGHGGPTASLSRFLVLGYSSELSSLMFRIWLSRVARLRPTIGGPLYELILPVPTSEIGSSCGQRIRKRVVQASIASPRRRVSARGCLGSRVVAPPQFRWRLRNQPAAHVEQTGHTAVAAEGGRRPLKDGTVTMSTNATCTFSGACGVRRGGTATKLTARREVSHFARK
jgi:hypothetical protein